MVICACETLVACSCTAATTLGWQCPVLTTAMPMTRSSHLLPSVPYGTDGSKWLDLVMGIAVVNTGHCHPKVVAAVQEQATKVSHAQMNIYRHQPMLDLT